MLIENGHRIEDIKYNYTVDQVYKFYEMCKKAEYDYYKMMAIVKYNAIACGSIPDSQKAASAQKKHWKSFIDKLDWDKLVSRAKAKPDPVKAFRGMSMIFNRGVK